MQLAAEREARQGERAAAASEKEAMLTERARERGAGDDALAELRQQLQVHDFDRDQQTHTHTDTQTDKQTKDM